MALIQLLILLGLFTFLGATFNYLSVTFAFFFLAVLLFIILSSIRLLYGLAIMIFAITLSPEIPVAGIPIRIEDLIVPVILFIWVFRSAARHEYVKPTRMFFPFAVFLFFMAAATVNSFIVNPDANRFLATFHFLKHCEYIVIFFLVLNIVEDRSDVQFLVYASLLATLIVTIQAQPQLQQVIPFGPSSSGTGNTGEIGRVAGVSTETANIFGGFLIFNFMIALSFFLTEDRWFHKIFFLLVLLSIIQPMAYTQSRSTYVGLSAGLVLLTILKRDLYLFLSLCLAPLIVASIFPDTVIDRFLSIFVALSNAELAPSWNARLQAWRQFIPHAIRNPFIGKGLRYVPLGYIDNEYVLRAVQTGFLGLLSFLWVFWRLATRSYTLFRDSVEKLDEQIGLGFMVGLFSIAVHALAATTFTTIRTAEPIYMFSGLIVANYLLLHRVERGDEKQEIIKSERKRFLSRSTST